MRRPGPPREIPPPLELESLKALWTIGEGTVRDVRAVLVEHRNFAYTTVMTVLDRLEKRGIVSRRKQGRSFVYAPKVSRDTMRRLALKEFVDNFFDGQWDALREFLASTPALPEEPSPEDTEPKRMEAALL